MMATRRGESSEVRLREMTPAEFEVFESYSLEFHIAQTASSQGLSRAETEALRKDIVARGIPGTPDTPGHFFLRVLAGDDAEPVGSVWFSIDPACRRAFLWDIVVEPDRRKAGIGSDVIRLVEERARALGCTRLALHTNPANAALRLYRRLGFDIVGVDLQRTIAS